MTLFLLYYFLPLNCFFFFLNTALKNLILSKNFSNSFQFKIIFKKKKSDMLFSPSLDCVILPIGPSIPQIPKPSNSDRMANPPDIAYLGLGDLPYSILIGFDFFAITKGSFEIQVKYIENP